MNKHLFILLFFLLFGCDYESGPGNAIERNPLEVITEDNVSVPVYDFDRFEGFLHAENDTIYIVNFWATWCKPCVEELPEFEKISKEFKGKKVKVVLASLDFYSRIKKAVIPFIKEHDLKSEILLLNDPDANSWINKVDKNWSGAIPATVIYHNDRRVFYEQKLNYEILKSHIINIK